RTQSAALSRAAFASDASVAPITTPLYYVDSLFRGAGQDPRFDDREGVRILLDQPAHPGRRHFLAAAEIDVRELVPERAVLEVARRQHRLLDGSAALRGAGRGGFEQVGPHVAGAELQ